MFKKNLNSKDRIFRFIAALITLFLGIHYKSKWILALSVFIFLEVFLNWCALYALFGINHCKVKK